eukprot:2623908-Pleurochrysis_carterae.AAC.1
MGGGAALWDGEPPAGWAAAARRVGDVLARAARMGAGAPAAGGVGDVQQAQPPPYSPSPWGTRPQRRPWDDGEARSPQVQHRRVGQAGVRGVGTHAVDGAG